MGGTRRWKKKNAIFLRETRTFIGNFIVSRGTDMIIPLEIEQSFIQLSNDILIGWIILQSYFAGWPKMSAASYSLFAPDSVTNAIKQCWYLRP